MRARFPSRALWEKQTHTFEAFLGGQNWSSRRPSSPYSFNTKAFFLCFVMNGWGGKIIYPFQQRTGDDAHMLPFSVGKWVTSPFQPEPGFRGGPFSPIFGGRREREWTQGQCMHMINAPGSTVPYTQARFLPRLHNPRYQNGGKKEGRRERNVGF